MDESALTRRSNHVRRPSKVCLNLRPGRRWGRMASPRLTDFCLLQRPSKVCVFTEMNCSISQFVTHTSRASAATFYAVFTPKAESLLSKQVLPTQIPATKASPAATFEAKPEDGKTCQACRSKGKPFWLLLNITGWKKQFTLKKRKKRCRTLRLIFYTSAKLLGSDQHSKKGILFGQTMQEMHFLKRSSSQPRGRHATGRRWVLRVLNRERKKKWRLGFYLGGRGERQNI